MELVNRKDDMHYPLMAEIIQIGRDANNQIILRHDNNVSRFHARLTFKKGNYWVEDLGSTNGSQINGVVFRKSKQLVPGDDLTIGDTVLKYDWRSARDKLDSYELLCELGRGGTGVVYKALDSRGKRIVAVKKLTAKPLSENEHSIRHDRFQREASLASRLHHPNLVKVFEVTLSGDNYYYVMELLEGNNLRDEVSLRGGHLSPQEYLPILEQIAAGLSYTHSMNIVHRDVKPQNIFVLADGVVKLTDFGIARTQDPELTSLTVSGSILGTLGYLSPEQLDNARHVDHRADIYSLGVVSYKVLSGEVPFAASGINELASLIRSKAPTPLNAAQPAVNQQTAKVIARAMSKQPVDRYSCVLDFVKDYKESLNLN